ncbi:MAG: glycosyltransferase family 4 protein [Puniceicoccaceae bacterium]
MSRSVHILTHEFHPTTGGIGTYVEETAAAAAEAGLEVRVWAPGLDEGGYDPFPYQVNRVRMRGKQDWLCRFRMASALKKAFPEGRIPGTLLLAEPGPIRLWMYASFLGLPRSDRLMVIFHGSELLALSRHRRRRVRLRQLLLGTDCIGCVSGPVRKMALNLGPDISSRVALVPGAVRSAWTNLPAIPRENQPEPGILHVGRIHPRKGQLELVEAAGRLPDTWRQSVRIRLVGPVGHPRYLDQIQQRAAELSVRLSLEGRLPEAKLAEAYRTAAMLVLPSQPYRNSVEGLGLSLLEAQHFGCPVVGTRIGGIPEAMEEGKSGLIVSPSDPVALANAIKQLLEDPPSASTMGMNGSRFVRETFSWRKNIQRLGLA